jgi:2-dehydro-3-deoxygluconokinase
MRPLLAIGETMVLVTPEQPESLETATAFRLDIAGAESNVASHLARAGVPAAWASAVGDDALGRRLVATLDKRGVDTSLVRVDPAAPTGVFFKDPGATGPVVKDGAVGAHAFAAWRTAFVPADRVDVVEPVGAGDAFAAGYLAADLAGEPAETALRNGHRFAARVLATTGDF